MPLCATAFSSHPTVAVVEVTDDTGALMTSTGNKATVKVPNLVESCALVALTVTEVPVPGAVRLPFASIKPAEVVHTTAELKPPVPVTAAEHVVEAS
jgi:hypothetical protein